MPEFGVHGFVKLLGVTGIGGHFEPAKGGYSIELVQLAFKTGNVYDF